jgi:hypothetical protein
MWDELNQKDDEELRKLIKDVYGNYVIQKFLEYEHLPEIRISIAKLLENNVFDLSKNTYGCRVVQKAMEVRPVCL